MAGRWGSRDGFGHYGAQGIPGFEALGNGIERMVTGIASSVDTNRGVAARLNYLTRSAAGYEAMERAGINKRRISTWVAKKSSPSPANRAKLDAAYWDLRRRNIARDLKRRLMSGGGTRIEIDPADETGVPVPQRRYPQRRDPNVRPETWAAAVDAWLAEDDTAMDAIWEYIILELGSDYDAYSYVSSVGWSA
ncbi:transcriptional regulator [Streptomyces xiamenensis]|uniref:transcriptional regulator n=1 Tax=Streptomyces xiamenensis TaxID=408015 RepID=UPI0035DEEC04